MKIKETPAKKTEARMMWRRKYYTVKFLLQKVLMEKKAKSNPNVIQLPQPVFEQIERQLQPKYRFKDPYLVKMGNPHIALTDGKTQIALLIPRKY